MIFRTQDGVTGTRFTPLPETTGGEKKRHWKWRAVIPKRWETNEESPPVAWANCLETVFRLWCRAGETQVEPQDFLSWVDGAESPGKTKSKKFTGQDTEEERAAWKLSYRGLWMVPLSIQQIADELLPVRKLPMRLGKRSSKRIRGNSAMLSHSATNSASSHNSDWKILWFVAHGKSGRGLEFCLSGD